MCPIADEPEPTGLDGDDAQTAAEAIADALNDQGFDVRLPGCAGSSFLQVTNVRGALCELSIGDSGVFDWEYRCRDSSRSDPAVLAAMAMGMLTGEHTANERARVTRDPGATLIGQVGRVLSGQGMQVCLNVLDKDEQLFEVYTEIAVTNPARPDRGTVRVGDDGLICWHCTIGTSGCPEGGVDLDDVSGTLGRVLAAA